MCILYQYYILYLIQNQVEIHQIICGKCSHVNNYDGLQDHIYNWDNETLVHHSVFNAFTNSCSLMPTTVSSWLRYVYFFMMKSYKTAVVLI